MEEKIESPEKRIRGKALLLVKKQVVAGFVIFRRTEEGIKFLLLYRRGSYWNFPKGHFEAGETSFDTALRETEEETGIGKGDLRIIPNFRATERFYFESDGERIHDTLILYLAETKRADVRISSREHSGFAWFLYHDAQKVIGSKYRGTRRVLKQARDFIRRMDGHGGARPQRGNAKRHPHPHPRYHRPFRRFRRGAPPPRPAEHK